VLSIAEQLYRKSTHFLLELIQNADDNSYERDTLPQLNITYRNKCLQVDCNETGFSERNVEAICRVGYSTKAGADHATRYVGEKGIGFKSVFKVADVVWILSRGYSFKFDKNARLGMIAPVGQTFPDKLSLDIRLCTCDCQLSTTSTN
jgi:HSP90 family molecular chaperone